MRKKRKPKAKVNLPWVQDTDNKTMSVVTDAYGILVAGSYLVVQDEQAIANHKFIVKAANAFTEKRGKFLRLCLKAYESLQPAKGQVCTCNRSSGPCSYCSVIRNAEILLVKAFKL
jgi:hypothetical protein